MEIDVTAEDVTHLPSLDYKLNVCLVNISREITDEDLDIMKCLISGEQGSPRGVLEKITTALKLFEHLKGRCLLSRDNILCLQAMLYHARRIDLFKELLAFAEERGDTLHCYPESDRPVNGYKYVRFHVAGTKSNNRSTLEAIRSAASTYMNVPSHFVTVQGIQATQSYLITFMVPEHCIEYVTRLKPSEKQCLLSLGVDFIVVEGKTITLQDAKLDKKPIPGIQLNEELQYYFKRNVTLQKQLEQYQLNEINAGFKLTTALSRSLTLLLTFLFNMVKYRSTKFVDSISVQSAHNYFQHSLEKVKGLGYDVHVIQSLLEAQSIIVRKQKLEEHRLLIQQQQYQIRNLEHVARVVQYERDKLKYFLGLSVHEEVLSRNDQFFIHGIMEALPSISVKYGLGILVDLQQLRPYLEEASTFLTKADRKRLTQTFEINQNEEKMFHLENHCFIEALVTVEQLRSGSLLDIDSFGRKLVSMVNRKEFEKQWQSQMQKFDLKHKQEQQGSGRPTPKEKETKTRTKSGHRMSSSQEDSSNKMDQVLDKVDLLTKRMTDIEKLICNPLARLDISRTGNMDSLGIDFARAQKMDED
ncbi:uncharacterized protein LOC127711006 [Mytilus californianus]|uniref:uncharacterized protein LOC127711006 n=1 Tax=Mytilus californianus TaxID=6549 RepID=UPI002246DF89|nr:uncharacterized protein LOC127711006 [Mytilus californianus]